MEDVRSVTTVAALEDNVRAERFSICEDAMLLCRAAGIDVVIEVTRRGRVRRRVAIEAFGTANTLS